MAKKMGGKNRLRKYIRSILHEEIEIAGFHGYGMNTSDMNRGGNLKACSSIWQSDGEASNDGCPGFGDGKPIDDSDIKLAVEYLNEEKPKSLVVYSRGSAVLCQALKYNVHVPSVVIFVAPAWRRWGPVNNSVVARKLANSKCRVIAGELDPKVPLKHAYELANLIGVNLEVLPACDHATGKDYSRGSLVDIGSELVKKVPELFKDLDTPKCKYGALIYVWQGLTGVDSIKTKNPERLPEWDDDSYANLELILQQIEAVRG